MSNELMDSPQLPSSSSSSSSPPCRMGGNAKNNSKNDAESSSNSNSTTTTTVDLVDEIVQELGLLGVSEEDGSIIQYDCENAHQDEEEEDGDDLRPTLSLDSNKFNEEKSSDADLDSCWAMFDQDRKQLNDGHLHRRPTKNENDVKSVSGGNEPDQDSSNNNNNFDAADDDDNNNSSRAQDRRKIKNHPTTTLAATTTNDDDNRTQKQQPPPPPPPPPPPKQLKKPPTKPQIVKHYYTKPSRTMANNNVELDHQQNNNHNNNNNNGMLLDESSSSSSSSSSTTSSSAESASGVNTTASKSTTSNINDGNLSQNHGNQHHDHHPTTMKLLRTVAITNANANKTQPPPSPSPPPPSQQQQQKQQVKQMLLLLNANNNNDDLDGHNGHPEDSRLDDQQHQTTSPSSSSTNHYGHVRVGDNKMANNNNNNNKNANLINHSQQSNGKDNVNNRDLDDDLEDVSNDYYYNKLPHWSNNIAIYQSVPTDDCLVSGGSDYGQMPFLTKTGEIIIEIDKQPVAGLTSMDVDRILHMGENRPASTSSTCMATPNTMFHTLKVLTGVHGFPLELREYLSRRFARGSLDHQLQELIRDNIYSRTLPITTRPARDGEVDGVDYRFISREEFLNMERAGLLLESGVYCNYYYGTPLPPSINAPTNSRHNASNVGFQNQDRMADIAEDADDDDRTAMNATTSNDPMTPTNGVPANDDKNESWSRMTAMAKRKRNRSNIVAIDAASLPYGWERISDAHYGVYYIDHINKRTQYERPYEIELVKGISGFGFTLIEIDKGLIVVKSLIHGGSASASGVIQPGDVLVSVAGVSVAGFQHSDIANLFSTFNVGDRVRLTFARGYQLPINLNEEDYDIINLKITKGLQGFGFTISEGHNGQKVKKILDLERCCSLKQGDILLSINGVDLTQMSHLDVVELLKQCPVDEPTEFMVKRKKRFRSKTPNNLHSSSVTQATPTTEMLTSTTIANLDQNLARNCKTPNPEMFYPKQAHPFNQHQQPPPPPPPFYKNFSNQNNLGTDEYNLDEMLLNNPNNANNNNSELYENYSMMMLMNHAQNNIDNGLMGAGNHHLYSNHQMDYATNYSQTNQQDFLNHRKSQSAPTLGGEAAMPSSSPSSSVIMNNDLAIGPDNNSNMPTFFGNVDIDFEYHQVTLQRTDSGFGFRIIGGSEDGSNVAIGSIVAGGSAHQDGTLKAGDELIAINGQYVIGASHQEVVQLMSQTGPQVDILVRRKRYLNAYDVTLQRQDYEGFGFVIISCGNCALIGRIIEGSPAHRCQRLHIRDRIIAVNGADVTNMSHPEIVNKIKESDDILHLRIVPADCYTCELVRGPNGYGFSIRGGMEFNGMPLFILCIAANGPASSLLQVGDEILEINEKSTVGMTHQEAVQLISQSAPSVRLRLRHNYGGGEFFNNLIRMPPPMPSSSTSLANMPTVLQQQQQQISPTTVTTTSTIEPQTMSNVVIMPNPIPKPPPPPPPKPCLSSFSSHNSNSNNHNSNTNTTAVNY